MILGPFEKITLFGPDPLAFLLDDTEDRNYVRDVFLIVPTGEDRNADVGVVGKLDLQHGRIFLGRDDIYHRYVRDGRPLR
jgi:hypothetical protein